MTGTGKGAGASTPVDAYANVQFRPFKIFQNELMIDVASVGSVHTVDIRQGLAGFQVIFDNL
jgi:hypothetical protein